MPLPEPKTLADQSTLQRYLNTLKSWTRQFRIIESSDIKPSVGPEGTVLSIKRHAQSSSESTPNVFRGEWRAGVSYSVGDMVIRGSDNHESVAWNSAASILGDGAMAGLYETLIAIDGSLGIPGPVEPVPAHTDGQYYWRTMARFAVPLLALRTTGSTQKIILDSSPGPSGSAISLALTQCNGRSLAIREVEVCVNNVTKHMLVLASAPY